VSRSRGTIRYKMSRRRALLLELTVEKLLLLHWEKFNLVFKVIASHPSAASYGSWAATFQFKEEL
jgi:hypothetical protein